MEKHVLKNPLEMPVQAFLSDSMPLGTVLAGILDFAGPAYIVVSTYSTGEEFLRRLVNLRAKGLVSHAVLIADVKAAVKTARIGGLAHQVFDEIRLCQNHSKVMLVGGETMKVSVLTSQNQTRGHRLENYCVLAGENVFGNLYESLLGHPAAVLWTKKK
ncbi:MAG: C4-dicarboxylate ABC transporter [Paraprevotella sp.]|nr:C4-dicarboxylate ABC transporter [Paraprevotella sp.]